ncbi:MAG: AAA family ATPase [Alphaproteobacteria bacterium]
MRIRQIELAGFKSFREPTRIALAPGLNAVVGPNGCGKSNVTDAIRWVLGEQSVRNLRADSMADVIFEGNTRSAALNLAEVTLTFEQDGDTPEFAGEAEGLAAVVARQSEFSITRRVHRSGESEYLINQSPARLRDITELFMGSGVGPKAYAMIEQGRVGQIVQAKPEDMRLYIEEAAGTTRFRSRKIAAERKLERTSENLARVNDVMREIERQLATLRRQAKRAEEYRLLVAELQSTEVALSASRWRALSREQEDARSEMTAARAEEASAADALGSAETARASLGAQEQEAGRRVEEALAGVAEVSGAVVRSSERQAAARNAVASIEGRLARAVEEIASLDAETRSAREGLAEAVRVLDEGRAVEAAAAAALGAVDAEV